uniref:Uncharacterized protein n=1 Tax=Arundo donax TaxID=35708 RepID=A0A0A9BDM2_ARUDO
MLLVTVRSQLATKVRLSSGKATKAPRCRLTKMEVQPCRLGSPCPRTTSCRCFTPSQRIDNLPVSH